MEYFNNIFKELDSLLNNPNITNQTKETNEIISENVYRILQNYDLCSENYVVSLIDFWGCRMDKYDKSIWEYISIKLLQITGVGYKNLLPEHQSNLVASIYSLDGQIISKDDSRQKIERFFKKFEGASQENYSC
jgi:hypothetical protein